MTDQETKLQALKMNYNQKCLMLGDYTVLVEQLKSEAQQVLQLLITEESKNGEPQGTSKREPNRKERRGKGKRA